MSQADLAKAAEVAQRSIGSWERDEAKPQGRNVLRTCEALGVTPSWLMHGEGPMKAEGSASGDQIAPFSDPPYLHAALTALTRVTRTRGVTLEPEAFSDLAVALVRQSTTTGKVPTEDDAVQLLVRKLTGGL